MKLKFNPIETVPVKKSVMLRFDFNGEYLYAIGAKICINEEFLKEEGPIYNFAPSYTRLHQNWIGDTSHARFRSDPVEWAELPKFE